MSSFDRAISPSLRLSTKKELKVFPVPIGGIIEAQYYSHPNQISPITELVHKIFSSKVLDLLLLTYYIRMNVQFEVYLFDNWPNLNANISRLKLIVFYKFSN